MYLWSADAFLAPGKYVQCKLDHRNQSPEQSTKTTIPQIPESRLLIVCLLVIHHFLVSKPLTKSLLHFLHRFGIHIVFVFCIDFIDLALMRAMWPSTSQPSSSHPQTGSWQSNPGCVDLQICRCDQICRSTDYLSALGRMSKWIKSKHSTKSTIVLILGHLYSKNAACSKYATCVARTAGAPWSRRLTVENFAPRLSKISSGIHRNRAVARGISTSKMQQTLDSWKFCATLGAIICNMYNKYSTDPNWKYLWTHL